MSREFYNVNEFYDLCNEVSNSNIGVGDGGAHAPLKFGKNIFVAIIM